MSQFYLDSQARSTYAKALKRFLTDQGLEIKHALANRAVAAMFGHNEHSLTAAIKAGEAPTVGRPHKCAVPGCDADAHVEVRLYSVVFGARGGVLDEQDFTCPYLCRAHLEENEKGAKGVRQPGGHVRYPYTNRREIEGFSIYRELFPPDYSKELEDARYTAGAEEALEVFRSEPVELLDCRGLTFSFRLGKLSTVITLRLTHLEDGDVGYVLSHAIKTPLQAGPYRASRSYDDSFPAAVRKAIRGLSSYYASAVEAGYEPAESWLVPY